MGVGALRRRNRVGLGERPVNERAPLGLEIELRLLARVLLT